MGLTILGGAGPGTSDTITSRVLLRPSSDTENAITIKRPSSTYGTGAYGTGQALEVLKDSVDPTNIGYTGVTPDDFVVARLTGEGSLGLSGNLHLATGLRQPAGYGGGPDTGWGCLYIQPYVNVPAISVQASETPGYSSAYFRAYDTTNTIVAQITAAGQLQLSTQGTNGGLLLGGDTALYRSGTKVATLTGALFVQGGIQIQPSTAANTVSIFFSGSTANLSAIQLGRAAAESQVVVANAANLVFTGVAAGDTVIQQVAGKLHIGVASGAAEIRVGDSQLGFYGTAPVAKPTVTGAKGSNAALASLLTALASMGLLTDSSTA